MATNLKINVTANTKDGIISIEKLGKSVKDFTQLSNNATISLNSFIKKNKELIDTTAHIYQSYLGLKEVFANVKNFSHSFIEAAKQIENAKTQLEGFNLVPADEGYSQYCPRVASNLGQVFDLNLSSALNGVKFELNFKRT